MTCVKNLHNKRGCIHIFQVLKKGFPRLYHNATSLPGMIAVIYAQMLILSVSIVMIRHVPTGPSQSMRFTASEN